MKVSGDLFIKNRLTGIRRGDQIKFKSDFYITRTTCLYKYNIIFETFFLDGCKRQVLSLQCSVESYPRGTVSESITTLEPNNCETNLPQLHKLCNFFSTCNAVIVERLTRTIRVTNSNLSPSRHCNNACFLKFIIYPEPNHEQLIDFKEGRKLLFPYFSQTDHVLLRKNNDLFSDYLAKDKLSIYIYIRVCAFGYIPTYVYFFILTKVIFRK